MTPELRILETRPPLQHQRCMDKRSDVSLRLSVTLGLCPFPRRILSKWWRSAGAYKAFAWPSNIDCRPSRKIMERNAWRKNLSHKAKSMPGAASQRKVQSRCYSSRALLNRPLSSSKLHKPTGSFKQSARKIHYLLASWYHVWHGMTSVSPTCTQTTQAVVW